MTARHPRFAIVGVGPRGLTVFERLCANLRKTVPGTVVEVVLIDAVDVATGAVWRTDQPGRLLMNTVASQITVFTDETVVMAGPVQVGPSLYEWARYLRVTGEAHDLPTAALAEATRLTPNSYPTRALFGHYLRWAYHHIRRISQDFLDVTELIGTAVDLSDEQGRQSIRLDNGQQIRDLDAVVLTQGHLPAREDESSRRLHAKAMATGLRRVPPGNAADTDLDSLKPQQPVLIRGLGLTFFDYLPLLTEGRGGRFVDDRGIVEYRPSGQEPLIYAGSRRGVPFHARGENQKGVSARHDPILLTTPKIFELRDRAASKGDLDFRRDVWPLIAKEVEITYYSTLLDQRISSHDLRIFRSEYAAAPWNSTSVTALLDRHAVPPERRWNWTQVTDPARGLMFPDSDSFQRWLLHYLDTDVRNARLGNVRGPVKAALDVLRDLRNEIRLVVDHQGITGSSYCRDLDRWYTPLNAYLSIGPPARRIGEMAAVMRAGLLRVIGPDMRVTLEGNRFTAMSPSIGDSRVSARYLIEARLPEPDIRRTTDPLMNRLLAKGAVRCYALPNPDGSRYRTGGLEVGIDHRLIDRGGRPHPHRFALGVPTEKVRWVTAAGPRPGVNSVTLADADEVARAMLRLAAIRLEPVPCVGCPH
ncbi:FAD/NAD(P)-binding protein [Nocardia pneumoniae]|uniref:FAD/NAD(P)-binding protein n=1 Tax=Nocardia pneumoniae TaxID=228601 RepID=UPI0002E6FCF9|nr:FAD/NAD(P)-binding protein [Nocardia pneumoniae]